jgi:hypothetical protein
MKQITSEASPQESAGSNFTGTLYPPYLFENSMPATLFIEQYFNRCRLHSASGYRPPHAERPSHRFARRVHAQNASQETGKRNRNLKAGIKILTCSVATAVLAVFHRRQWGARGLKCLPLAPRPPSPLHKTKPRCARRKTSSLLTIPITSPTINLASVATLRP